MEIAEMAQLNPNILMNCLTKGDHNWRYNDSDSDLDASSAAKIRNTICRTLYGRLFTWIAGKINESLKVCVCLCLCERNSIFIMLFFFLNKFQYLNSDTIRINTWETFWNIRLFWIRNQ